MQRPSFQRPPPTQDGSRNLILWALLILIAAGVVAIFVFSMASALSKKPSALAARSISNPRELANEEAHEIDRQVNYDNYGDTDITFEPTTDYGKAYKQYCLDVLDAWRACQDVLYRLSFERMLDGSRLSSAEGISQSREDIQSLTSAYANYFSTMDLAGERLSVAAKQTFGRDAESPDRAHTAEFQSAVNLLNSTINAALDLAEKDKPVLDRDGKLKWTTDADAKAFAALKVELSNEQAHLEDLQTKNSVSEKLLHGR